MNTRPKLYTGLLMIALCAISIIVRLPNLAKLLGDHHQWLTSTVLRHQQIWYVGGALKYNFITLHIRLLPIYSYMLYLSSWGFILMLCPS